MDRRHTGQATIREVISERVSRRGFLLGGTAGLGVVAAHGFVGSLFSGEAFAQDAKSSLAFTELKRVYDDKHHVADGYTADVVVAWGDALKPGLDAFDPAKLDAAGQAKRFGYNCDYVAFMPLPKGSDSSSGGLLCVNNEYVSPNVMFEATKEDDAGKTMTKEQVALCNMAIGHSIVEVTQRRRCLEGCRRQPDEPAHHPGHGLCYFRSMRWE